MRPTLAAKPDGYLLDVDAVRARRVSSPWTSFFAPWTSRFANQRFGTHAGMGTGISAVVGQASVGLNEHVGSTRR